MIGWTGFEFRKFLQKLNVEYLICIQTILGLLFKDLIIFCGKIGLRRFKYEQSLVVLIRTCHDIHNRTGSSNKYMFAFGLGFGLVVGLVLKQGFVDIARHLD